MLTGLSLYDFILNENEGITGFLATYWQQLLLIYAILYHIMQSQCHNKSTIIAVFIGIYQYS